MHILTKCRKGCPVERGARISEVRIREVRVYYQKMMTHRFVMTSSLLIKILKIDKFGDFSSDIDYNSRTDIFRDDISLIINQSDSKRTQCPPAAQRM